MLPKPNKNIYEFSSYKLIYHISLLSILTKILEKVVLSEKKIIVKKQS